jgi:hypothetical protein
MRGAVAAAVIACPQGTALYRQRMSDLTADVFRLDWMLARIDTNVRLLESAEGLVPREAVPLRERLRQRVQFLQQSEKQ